MTGDELRELQDRGRFFYESFPGAKAAQEWKRAREAAERKHVEASDSRPDSPDARPAKSASLDPSMRLPASFLRGPTR